ncbi:MAG: toprim domain-containing protein [bacterium]|nr:toprim domain-containing protein [bacterium]
MNEIDRLTEYFREFPGIGPRQAKRFVYFLLRKDSGYIKGMTDSISNLKKYIKNCPSCFRFFLEKNFTDPNHSLCSICSDKNRDAELLMVTAKDSDMDVIEKSHSYNGLYFILGANIQILEKNPEHKVRLSELVNKIENSKLKEVIISMSANTEGEHTIDIIRGKIAPISLKNGFKITVLGRGLSTGAELEYSDSETIKEALKHRG